MPTHEPNTVLRGGPNQRSGPNEKVCYVDDASATLKVQNGNCYDHFRETSDRIAQDGRELRVFAWTHRTYVAE